ncbi:serine hydrolase [Wenzhouxiangella sp. EGI_FJ10409]|uniref:serine hydrolase n=1 Tax=Wenzhouxiangella sp. EGI_FJ10409 TaxID=3243767 RepID=UPI0035D7C724
MRIDSKWTFLRGAVAPIALTMAFGLAAAESNVSIEAELDEAVASGSVLSARAAIVRDGELRHFGAGRLEPGGEAEPDAATSYQIGSVSKAFTNLLLAEMVAAGKVAYDTRVADLLGDEIEFANPAVSEITLLELATHTSGLPRLPLNLSISDPADPYADYGEADLLDALGRTREGQPLGDRYAYSNYGVGLMGYLLGRVHGGGYSAALEALVLEPLGLADTGVEPRTAVAAAFTGGEAVPAWNLAALAGAGALWSTTADMARLARAELGLAERALEHEPAQGREIVAPAKGGRAVTPVWHVAETPAGPVYWHNGATAGHRSFIGFRPATADAVVLLAAGDLDPAELALAWFDASSGADDGPALEAGMAGQYRLTPQVGIGVYEADSGPMAQLSGQSPTPIMPAGDGWYAFNVADASMKFLREDGEITAVELVQNGRTQRAEKVADTARVLSRRSLETDRDQLADYVGEYALAPGARFTIRISDDGLEARLTGQPFFPIHFKGDDVFFYKVVDAELHFQRNEQGEVDALVLHQGGIEQRAERIE